MIIEAFCCYSEKENEKVLEFHMSNCSYFETGASFY